MTYTAHDPRTFFAAITTQLATTGRPIGLAKAPANTSYPYAVIYPGFDESQEGTLNDPSQIVVWGFQVTCVSNNPEGAQWMQHLTRQALHGWTPTVTGLGTTPVELAQGSGINRDDIASPPLFYSTDRFSAYTSI